MGSYRAYIRQLDDSSMSCLQPQTSATVKVAVMCKWCWEPWSSLDDSCDPEALNDSCDHSMLIICICAVSPTLDTDCSCLQTTTHTTKHMFCRHHNCNRKKVLLCCECLLTPDPKIQHSFPLPCLPAVSLAIPMMICLKQCRKRQKRGWWEPFWLSSSYCRISLETDLLQLHEHKTTMKLTHQDVYMHKVLYTELDLSAALHA